MCRLYGMRATHPTNVSCELLDAQNALIRQSVEDERGLVNDDGWGIGMLVGDELRCEREVGPAAQSEEYRRDAASADATLVIAHVRRATVGGATVANTHPFRKGRSLLAHNGHIGAFDKVSPVLLDELSDEERDEIRGTTDSEAFFELLLSRWRRNPETPMRRILRDGIRDVRRMVREADPDAEVAMNVLWSMEDELVGSRLGRSLHYLRREESHRCASCGELHPRPGSIPEGERYVSAEVASEPITEEDWTEVPEASVFSLDDELRLEFAPIGA